MYVLCLFRYLYISVNIHQLVVKLLLLFVQLCMCCVTCSLDFCPLVYLSHFFVLVNFLCFRDYSGYDHYCVVRHI